MIERYSRPQMKRVWSEESKFDKWLQVEIAVCEAWAELGTIPQEAIPKIRTARYSLERIGEILKVTHHDVTAFLKSVSDSLGEESRFIHLGLTSSDVIDTALSLQLKQASQLLRQDVAELLAVLEEKAVAYKQTIMMGRTHGVHAEPTTFGLKLALWAQEMKRNAVRLAEAEKIISVGKISGAVGTYATVPPEVENKACIKLGLAPAPISSQIIQRDRHAFAVGQTGSSAMPHKRNPELCERVCGLARLIRGNALTSMENVALWHERDISHSSTERIILPDSCLVLDYVLSTFTSVMKGLQVYPENMRRNLELTQGLVFSQRVLIALIDKGLSRQRAYELVQRNAMKAWEQKNTFLDLLKADTEVTAQLSESELGSLFEYGYFLRHVDKVFQRLGLTEKKKAKAAKAGELAPQAL